jgi:hypothetical protein
VFLKYGSIIRCLASLRRVRQDAVPRVHRYYQDTMTSCRPSRVTSSPSFGDTTAALVLSLSRGRVPPRKPGVGARYLRPGCFRGNDRISQVPGQPQLSVCTCSPTPARRLLQTARRLPRRFFFRATAWPPLRERQRLSQKQNLRSSITWLSDSLSTLRHARYLTQRKTRFRPSVKRYRTGFPPAGSLPEVSNSHHVNHPPPPSFLTQALCPYP